MIRRLARRDKVARMSGPCVRAPGISLICRLRTVDLASPGMTTHALRRPLAAAALAAAVALPAAAPAGASVLDGTSNTIMVSAVQRDDAHHNISSYSASSAYAALDFTEVRLVGAPGDPCTTGAGACLLESDGLLF
jgi:hypothetical protein